MQNERNMAVASLSSYSGQNFKLMRNIGSNTNSLVAMLQGSCSPRIASNQVPRSMGSPKDMTKVCGQKRPFYPTIDRRSVEEPDDDDEGADEFSLRSEKKRRLSFDQVQSLERSFELENKLEPERKLQLAKELGLQPRQVAVWFQNRRARWKIKQLERDYGALAKDYNRLKEEFEAVSRDRNGYKAEVNLLKGIRNDDPDSPITTPIRCLSETMHHPASPAQSEKSDIISCRNCASPSIDVNPVPSKEAGVTGTMSPDCNSSNTIDADSPLTSHSTTSWRSLYTRMAQTDKAPWGAQHTQFPPESFAGPNFPHPCADQSLAAAVAGARVKIHNLGADQAFVASRMEEQTILTNWWDWD